MTGLNDTSSESNNLAVKIVKFDEVGVGDGRVHIIEYLKDPSRGANRRIRYLTFKYIFLDEELYRRTTKDLLLKCLDTDQARVAMGEVHEGICEMHQSAPKIKWLLRRADFHWISVIANYFC
jgi:hypothetical protein